MSKFISFLVIVLLTFSFFSCDDGKDKEDYSQEIQNFCHDMLDCGSVYEFFWKEEGDDVHPWTDESSCWSYMAEMKHYQDYCRDHFDDCDLYGQQNNWCYYGLIDAWQDWLSGKAEQLTFDTIESKCGVCMRGEAYYNCYPKGYPADD